MTITHHNVSRTAGALLLSAVALMTASAAVAVPAGLALNPQDPAATLRAVQDRVGLHLLELGLDVLGWLALTGAALALAVCAVTAGRPAHAVPAGLLALCGTAGLLHDAGNLAVTRLAADPADPVTAATAEAVLLTAKWGVNLAGLLWVSATAAAVCLPGRPAGRRRAGAVAALSGLAAVVLPWTTGTDGPSPQLEQLGYALHLPVMAWWGFLGWRCLRTGPTEAEPTPRG
ncbi:MAG TPA: hypothetical protein VFU12_17590 [Glycomyces sp.]|nr:hypothetical protein [Glycomyces sp.]